MNQPTAILLFSRSASTEAVTKFGGCRRGGLRVANALIGRTKRTLDRVGLPVIHFDEAAQVGDTFGDRLDGCLKSVFSEGYGSVIVVGNDSPGLTVQHLRAAAHQLTAGRDVLGPDRRGGIFLIGIRQSTFESASLRSIPWQTNGVYRELHRVLGTPELLRPLADCNGVEDILLNWKRWKARLSELYDIVCGRTESEWEGKRSRPCIGCRDTFGRAPPARA
ncbi:hypothetical protein CLV84_4082 [Neolewinella xylanilytica]|uniref:DUF2064 domain-containing protein n=1 Tax=Neolewinella xylanilytica TaxID=1514080 RepID=A0A2S6I0C2_9BACT|nr:DUF2064 domain-containing protein [Neolewinella xylanilytica]PPK84312.1 hypothetical protein CLV84_4082 [Neolewinella xylanilytica]